MGKIAHLNFIAISLLCLTVQSPSLWAQGSNHLSDNKVPEAVSSDRPPELEGVGIEEKLGTKLDPEMTFKDETGKVVRFGDYFAEGKPIIISPVYFSCPGLCNFHLNGLVEALRDMDWTIGDKFTVLAVSFDAKETPVLAAEKKVSYVQSYGRPEAASGFHFLTGDDVQVKKFVEAVGFKMKWMDDLKEWSHGSSAIIVNPSGEITRYLPGIIFDAKDVRLALNESMAGKIGSFVDSLVLYCFKYNPHQSKYTASVFNIMKLGGLFTVLLLLIWIIPFWFRARQSESESPARSAS